MTTTLQAVEVYTPGTKAWFADKQEAWVSATCVSNTVQDGKVRLVFESDADSKEYVYEESIAQIEKNGGDSLPPLRNPPKLEYTDDLTNLSHLNEPSVLNTIKTRYVQRLIYTYSGIVLIAVNPFDRVALYDPDIVQQYSGKRRGELEPHLFAIAEDAYRCMIREKMNQTIVVSGESGAGKTVSAKYIMRYFATADDQESLGKKKKVNGAMTEVEEQILATNPIMEAFGNAKTTRNDNSSRFGKYIEIQFDSGANIVGAKIRTYLLERSRLIFQPATERNYHIFYQLCAGAPVSEKREFELGDYTNFHYLNQSGTGTIPNVDDAVEFEATQRALSTVGLSVQLQWKIFRLLAALLHIGNIQITGRADAMLAEDDNALLLATRLMGINETEFRKWIIRKQIVTRSEKIVTNLTPAQAVTVKDSVAKYVYANLFEWLVSIINDSLACKNSENVATFIGVLDIYGFEHFKKNSFEQFCINYANEKLQQQFNQHVFKLEQEEYVREKINWNFIEFTDNQKCIELIEGKLGVLSLLDEESRLPAGTDQGFCQKLYQNFSTPNFKNFFKKPRFGDSAFIIAHYAHDVQYESEGFLDKNKDTVPDEHLALLQSSEFDFLKDVLERAAANNPAPPTPENKRMSTSFRKPTLGSIFKLSLINLMDTIGSTNVHYIRCIKPNEAKTAWVFEPLMVLSQLRACGVLETIRISCAGYPSRWTFEEFADRYYALVPSKHWDNKDGIDVPKLCNLILDASIKDKDKYQIGTTKIFFRAGQLAYMEKLRADRFNYCATLIQKNIRRYICRTKYLRTRNLALQLQCIARKKAAQSILQHFREERAALKIQTAWRRYSARKAYLAQRRFILSLQTVIRKHRAQHSLIVLRENHAALQIQRLVRGWFARKQMKAKVTFIIQLQSCIRRRIARQQFIELRNEARSAHHFKEISYQLENKIVELTQTITSLKEERKAANDRSTQLEAQIRTWMEKYEKAEKKNRTLEMKLQEPTVPQDQWDTLKQQKENIEAEHRASLEKIKTLERDVSQLNEELIVQKNENNRLQKALEEATEKAKAAPDENEVAELRSQVSALKTQLAQLINQPRRQQSVSNAPTLAPSRSSGTARRLSPSPIKRTESPVDKDEEETEAQNARPPSRLQSSLPTSKIARRYSTADTATNGPKSPTDGGKPSDIPTKMPRPTSIHQFSSLRGPRNNSFSEDLGEHPEEELVKILQDEDGLQEEIIQGLITRLRMPMPSLQNPPSQKEVFFPAHTITLCVVEMWKHNRVQESERLLFNVMDTIQKQCLNLTGDQAITPCAFWLTNTHELFSLITKAEHDHEREMRSSTAGKRKGYSHDFGKLLETLKYELQALEDTIFHTWMKELKRRVNKMVIPAIIEGQSLPGFVSRDTGRFFGKSAAGTQQTFSMDDLLNFLNRTWRTMKCYYIERAVANQVMTELLKLIGVTSFNDLLMRKNFSSWKRAMQIQYNCTRLEEWCKSHEMPEGTLQLEHLLQAAKLLQSKKATLEDVDHLFDVCWILSPTQIQKLITQYQAADYENPMRPEIVKAVADRVANADKSDVLLLDSVSLDDTTNPYEIPAPRESELTMYLPAWLKLTRLRRLTLLAQYRNEAAVQATAVGSS